MLFNTVPSAQYTRAAVSRGTLCPRAGQPGGSGDAADTPEDAFPALPAPITERILYAAFVAGERRMAARARLCCVCKCGFAPPSPLPLRCRSSQFPLLHRMGCLVLQTQACRP